MSEEEVVDVVDSLVDQIEDDADRLGISSLEIADRIKAEITAKMEMG